MPIKMPLKTMRLPLIAFGGALMVAGTAYAVDALGDDPHMQTMTRAQAQTKAQEAFTMLDVDKNGKLDAADRAARQGAMFDGIDADHNGQISREEFAAHHQGPMADGAGMSGDHRMGRGGMHHEGRRGLRHGRGQHDGMMMARMADTNKDNAVSQAEFSAAMLAMFDRADTNKDGSVTPEERRAARAAMRGAMGDHPPMVDAPKP